MEAIKGANVRHQACTFFLVNFPDCSVALVGVLVDLGVGHTAILKPGVQLSKVFELWPRGEEPTT